MQQRITNADELGAAIRQARKAQGLTQKQLAGFFSGFSREFLSDLENGKPTVELGKALAVANALGVQVLVCTDGPVVLSGQQPAEAGQ